MTVVLIRVDERLIHGQVVLGWGSQLSPTRYLVVDDDLAHSEWEQELYRLAVSDGATVEFVSVQDGPRRLEALAEDEERTLLLTRDVATMVRLGRAGGLRGWAVNLGGIHYAEGKTQVRSYLFLGDEDRQGIRDLIEAGATVTGRDLPDSAQVSLEDLLEVGSHE